MQIWPAIDLRGGKCVRLMQGDYQRETVYGDDPAAMARRARIAVIALGGINARTARQLRGRGFAGLAAVEAFAPA